MRPTAPLTNSDTTYYCSGMFSKQKIDYSAILKKNII